MRSVASFGDPRGNRTPVTAVKGRCLDRLTNEPLYGAGNRTRTYNLLITSQLLYQLSHTSILFKKYFGDLEGARTLDLQRDRLAF